MRLLIIGGTRFVGRHITERALAAGHEVTLLHRGTTGMDLFTQVNHVLVDRDDDLSALVGLHWDVTVDVCAFQPRQIRHLAEAISTDRYVLVSSTSVYAIPKSPGFTEESPLNAMPAGADGTVNDETYGPLKALCEVAARQQFGVGTLIVRPTYIVGPYDHMDRFAYWVNRFARGDEVLAPMERDWPMQVIDARDLAEFVVGGTERGISGTFHLAHPAPGYTFGRLLEDIAAAVAPAGTSITWVGERFLREAGMTDVDLPMWGAFDPWMATNTADSSAAVAAGLSPRPVGESARDTLGTTLPGKGWLSVDHEARLLAAWRLADPAERSA